jgi:hypothetical protein
MSPYLFRFGACYMRICQTFGYNNNITRRTICPVKKQRRGTNRFTAEDTDPAYARLFVSLLVKEDTDHPRIYGRIRMYLSHPTRLPSRTLARTQRHAVL